MIIATFVLMIWLHGLDGPALGPYVFETKKDCEQAQNAVIVSIKSGIVSCAQVLNTGDAK